VLISSEDARAFELFVRTARQGLIPNELPTDRYEQHAALMIPKLDIAPVTIEPLAPAARVEGELP
jgi:hypothetical protein